MRTAGALMRFAPGFSGYRVPDANPFGKHCMKLEDHASTTNFQPVDHITSWVIAEREPPLDYEGRHRDSV